MKISVFIPTYNSLESLKRACSSVLEQGDFVVLDVLDNCSTDGTREWLRDLARDDGRVHLTLREHNIGVMANYADGFLRADGDFVVPLASDDELKPGFLKRGLEVARKHQDVGAVIFQSEFWKNGTLQFINPSSLPPGRLEPSEHLRHWISIGHYFSWSGILWKQSLLREIKAREQFERYAFSGDAWIQFLVFSRAAVYSVPSPGAVLNMHSKQTSRNMGPENIVQVVRMLKEIEKAVRHLGYLSDSERDELLRKLFVHWNAVIEWGLWKTTRAFDEKDVFAALEIYMTNIYPRIGFTNFPLLPLFPAHRDKISQSDIHKLQWMEKSLSWKITRPLRELMTWKNQIFGCAR